MLKNAQINEFNNKIYLVKRNDSILTFDSELECCSALKIWFDNNKDKIEITKEDNKVLKEICSFRNAKKKLVDQNSINFECKCLIINFSPNVNTYEACPKCNKHLVQHFCPKCQEEQHEFKFNSVMRVS